MLYLTPKEAEQIVIGDDITLTIVRRNGSLRIGIDAPREIPIKRQNILTSPPTPVPFDVPTWPVVTVADETSLAVAKQQLGAA